MPDPFLRALKASIRGQVLADPVSRGIYASDASHHQIMPACVCLPMDVDDLVAATRLASEFRVPITPRGAGTSLSGQTTWTGMVLDLSKYMNHIVEVNVDEKWVRVQPGVVRDELNQHLAPFGLHFAPDPATGNRAAVGGMIGNNSSGTRSIVYGKTIDHVLECHVVLADGTPLHLKPCPAEEWQRLAVCDDRLGRICAGVGKIIEGNREEIFRRYPKVMRRVSGYNLDAFLPESQGGQGGPWNLSHLIVGSEGTLSVLREAKLRLVPVPKATALCIVHFSDLMDALRAVPPILEHRPSAVELLDDQVLAEALRNRATASMADFLEGSPRAVQIVELCGDSMDEIVDRMMALVRSLQQRGIGYAWPLRLDPEGVRRVWEVRKLGLGLISNRPGRQKGAEFAEDACVPVHALADYIAKVQEVCASHGVGAIYYAHASVGVLHVRPMLDLHDPADVLRMRQIANELFEIVVSLGGSWSSEHGDGLVRGEFIPRFYGPVIYQAFRDVKRLFDPEGIMNPGKIVDSAPMTSFLRYGPDYRPSPPPSRFHYHEQGGFTLAVEQCNGVGACRKMGSGTMCPSYMATRDEEHSTRGRANALRMAMSGPLGPHALTQDRLAEVLELCLSCKACKSECPNAVDMSRLKSDVLRWRYREHGTPLHARLLAGVPDALRWSSGRFAGVAGWLQQRGFVRAALRTLAHIDPRRPLPTVARQTLADWFRHRPRPPAPAPLGRVLLFCDTFSNYLDTQVGRAAVRLLESCGYDVDLADVGCCQRPAISQGLLDRAAVRGKHTLTRLAELQRGRQAQAVVVLEPSCASALIDDLPDLLAAGAFADLVPRIAMIDIFLSQAVQRGDVTKLWRSPHPRLLIHGHCHQKALFGTMGMKSVLAGISGLEWAEIDSGCCGMAGSFGYEHFDLSCRIGEDRLFPAIRGRKPGTEVVACGMSCRHQIADIVGVRARHWVEVVEPVTP